MTGDAVGKSVSDTEIENFKPTIASFSDVGPELRKALYEHNNHAIEQEFLDVEAKVGMKREHIVCVISGLIGLYLLFGEEAGLLCNLIGFAYPATASVATFLLLYLMLPQTRGAQLVHAKLIAPLYAKIFTPENNNNVQKS
ncbi:unnamed protein product [Gongylonema pulchrum]|uniref:Signal peptidase complex subunit 2 n=1 Tax=Gongylonema pulchrum TaxID=637853 RepID=A0A183ECX0_9BILA|nr:unnamed protein product [Gongylonema pulchrum]